MRKLKIKRIFSCLHDSNEIFNDSVITTATVHRFVNGFFLGHLWDVAMWLWSPLKIGRCRHIGRNGGVEGMWGWKATKNNTGMTKSRVLRTCVTEWRRFLAEALPFGLWQMLMQRRISCWSTGRLALDNSYRFRADEMTTFKITGWSSKQNVFFSRRGYVRFQGHQKSVKTLKTGRKVTGNKLQDLGRGNHLSGQRCVYTGAVLGTAPWTHGVCYMQGQGAGLTGFRGCATFLYVCDI